MQLEGQGITQANEALGEAFPPGLQGHWAAWAKSLPTDHRSVAAHAQDTAAVLRVMCELDQHLGPLLVRASGLSNLEIICAYLGLHDITKVTPAFQMSWIHALGPQWRSDASARVLSVERLREHLPPGSPPAPAKAAHHTALSWSASTFAARRHPDRKHILDAVYAAHHGHIVHGVHPPHEQIGGVWWAKQRLNLERSHYLAQGVPSTVLNAALNPTCPAAQRYGGSPLPGGAAWALLAGMTTTADWIASGALTTLDGPAERALGRAWRWPEGDADLTRRWPLALDAARRTLRELGWRGRQTLPGSGALHATPRDLHRLLDEALNEALAEQARSGPQPLLIIAEAPTGEGKTSAAVQALRALFTPLNLRGMNMSQHTRAAGVALHKDVSDLIRAGQDLDGHDLPVLAMGGASNGFFGARGSALLAPGGVGTIDQLLLGVVASHRWNAVRLAALSNKLIVIDEVHAADPVMWVLLRALLPWLRALNSSVMLMSATLPSHKREELERAWGAPAALPPSSAEPVAVRVTTPQRTIVRSGASAQRPRRFVLKRAATSAQGVADLALELARQGRSVAVVMSTVDRAQDVARALIHARVPDSASPEGRAAQAAGEPRMVTIHSRLPGHARSRRERHAIQSLGKDVPPRADGRRDATGLIAVGTSVFEMSLDIDVDTLITDPAGMESFLQRIGRVWRHAANDPFRQRPPHAPWAADVWICGGLDPALDPGRFKEGWMEAAWTQGELNLRLAALALLRTAPHLDIPAQARELVEAAYARTFDPALDPALRAHLEDLQRRDDETLATLLRSGELRCAAGPDELPHTDWWTTDPRSLPAGLRSDSDSPNLGGQDDLDPQGTRVGGVSVRFLPLWPVPGGWSLTPGGSPLNAAAPLWKQVEPFVVPASGARAGHLQAAQTVTGDALLEAVRGVGLCPLPLQSDAVPAARPGHLAWRAQAGAAAFEDELGLILRAL
ncbi:CRISPR-associated helicase Cas3' [Deinococcus soli (ex Cha et al. 2016)]|nr:CRISPR-associated helicase Cas3' [Deinococcus soli (ex Cha et al. 2016)]